MARLQQRGFFNRPLPSPPPCLFKRPGLDRVLPDFRILTLPTSFGRRLTKLRVRGTKVDVRGTKVDVRVNNVDVRVNKLDVRGTKVDVRGTSVDVRGNNVDVRGANVDVRGWLGSMRTPSWWSTLGPQNVSRLFASSKQPPLPPIFETYRLYVEAAT
eukprot:5979084-Pyramimonas_sp.AAC.1